MLGYLLCKLIIVLSLDLSRTYTDGPNSQTMPAYAVYICIMIVFLLRNMFKIKSHVPT